MRECNGRKRSKGHWRASLFSDDEWHSVRPAEGRYADGSLLEWGSITKGVVAETAARTLQLRAPVSEYLPEFGEVDFTVESLIRHTSGLPRMPLGSSSHPFADPYGLRQTGPLRFADLQQTGRAGAFLYSNLGYAVLGAVLEKVHGDWLEAAQEFVLKPAGLASATLTPLPDERILPRNWRNRTTEPWRISASAYAAAGGLWSTFEDLCRYAVWSMNDVSRRLGWQSSEDVWWVNGELKSSGAAIVAAQGKVAVTHVLERPPGSADRLALRLLAGP